MPEDRTSWSARRLVGVSLLLKIVVDTTAQFFNPFLPFVAEGLGTTIVTMGRLVSLRSIMGLAAPGFGSLSDRIGYRRTIRITLLLAAVGTILVGASPNVAMAAVGMAVMGLGLGSFVPLLHAYLSSRLPWNLRARGLGVVEYAWALTGILGLSLLGWVIAATSWRVPLILLGFALVIASIVVGRLPATHHAENLHSAEGLRDTPRSDVMEGPQVRPSLWERTRSYFALGPTSASTYSTIAAGSLNYFGAMQLMIIYGVWLDDGFGLGPAAIGSVALVFGIFDLTASVLVSLFADRMGKRRSVFIGVSVASIGYLALPWMGATLATAVLGIAIARMGFETGVVSHFPLLSEQTPDQRAKVMTLGSAAMLTFATAAGFTSPWLYTVYGIAGVAVVSLVAAAGSLLILVLFVHERPAHSPSPPLMVSDHPGE